MSRASPFKFGDFARAAPSVAEPAPARTFAREDLDEAREGGILEGRRLAMETIAADEAAALSRIASSLEAAADTIEHRLAEARAEALAVTRAFVEEFCIGIAAAREVEIADDLLRRLTENSEDRSKASLLLNSASLERLRTRLDAALASRRVADFVSLEGDEALKPGEARLEWRGGGARRTRAEIAAAVAAVFGPLNEPENVHERA